MPVRLYEKQNFSGDLLSGQHIMVTPILAKSGRLNNSELESRDILSAVGSVRKDLSLLRPDKFEEWYQAKRGQHAMDEAYRAFFEGKMVALQNSPKFWKELESNYLMVLKLTSGLRIKTPDEKSSRRQLRLEGELWDCDSMEVVWRAVVDCRSSGSNKSDSELILKAVASLFTQLPPVRPGYGKDAW